MRHIIFLISCMMFLAGCMSTVEIPTRKAAQYKWPESIQKVGLVDAVYGSPGLDARLEDPEHYANEAMKFLFKNLNDGGRFEPVWITGNYYAPDDSLSEIAEAICSKRGLDGVVILTHIDYDFGETDRNALYDGYGNLRMWAIADITVNCNYRFYDADGHLLDDEVYQIDGQVRATGLSEYDTEDRFEKKTVIAFNRNLQQATREYAERLSPVVVIRPRKYYMGVNFGESNQYLKFGMFKKAQEELFKVYDEVSSPRAKAKIAYNLALIYEALLKIDSSFVWIDKSLDHKELEYAGNYKKYLDKREQLIKKGVLE